MNSDTRPTLVVITGPTAVGKTSAGIRIAKQFQTEIISADSRQFYREMRIGTARPSDEELKTVPHHFIAHLSIHDDYNVSRFENDALKKLEELFRFHDVVLMVGGSGLYINAVCHGIDDLPDPDPALREELNHLYEEEGLEGLNKRLRLLDPLYFREVDRANPKRLLRALEVCITTGKPFSQLRKNSPKTRSFRIVKIGLNMPREELNQRIELRVDQMMEEGLLAEAQELFPHRHLNALNTVGYKELFDYMDGKCTLDQAVTNIKTSTRRFAKRQMTWFRKDNEIRWLHPEDWEGIVDELMS